VLAVVLGDFGRDAGLRFASVLSRMERRRLRRDLGDDAAFYDEHRRVTLAVVGDLPFVKAPWLQDYRAARRPLDDRILVGFPGGVPLQDVVPRLGVLALEAMAGPVQRGVEQVLVLLPCNTLAPAAWALDDALGAAGALHEMLDTAGLAGRHDLYELADRVAVGVATACPTVPQAAIRAALQAEGRALLPLGTEGIDAVYERAIEREGGALELVRPTEPWQRDTLAAIRATIAGERGRARALLQGVAAEARAIHGDDLIVVEACTDLDHGVGWDSTQLYAEDVVEEIYSPSLRRRSSLSESNV